MFAREITINGKTSIGYNYLQPTNADEALDIIDLEWDLRQLKGGYPVENDWFHSDYNSKLQQMGFLIMGLNIPSNLQWKTMSGSFVTMTPILANQIFQSASQYEFLLFTQAQNLKTLVTSPNFDFTTFDQTQGWVTAFWELT